MLGPAVAVTLEITCNEEIQGLGDELERIGKGGDGRKPDIAMTTASKASGEGKVGDAATLSGGSVRKQDEGGVNRGYRARGGRGRGLWEALSSPEAIRRLETPRVAGRRATERAIGKFGGRASAV